MRHDEYYQKMVWFVGFRSLYNEILRFEVSKKGQNLLGQQKSGKLKLDYFAIESLKQYKPYHFLIELVVTHLSSLVPKFKTSSVRADVIVKYGRFRGFWGNFWGTTEPKLTNKPIFVIYSFRSFQ